MRIQIRFAHPSERAFLINLQRRASLVWEEYRDDLLAHPEAIYIPLAQFRKRQVRIAISRANGSDFPPCCR